MSSIEKHKPDLRSEFGLACPTCGAAEELVVEITCSATLTVEGTEPTGDHYWDGNTPCYCDTCGHHGSVDEFRVAEKAEVQP